MTIAQPAPTTSDERPAGPNVAVIDDPRYVSTRHDAGEHAFARHVHEAFGHLRLPYATLDRLTAPAEGVPVVLTAGLVDDDTGDDDPGVAALLAWVRDGGTLIRTDTTTILDTDAGITSRRPGSGLVECRGPWPQQPTRPIRAIAGSRLEVTDDTNVWARWSEPAADGAVAVAARQVGEGMIITFGVDVWETVIRIVQGFPVTEDGRPAADGSAPIDDDILKCEDGLGLDLDEDRALPPGEEGFTAPYPYGFPPPVAAPLFDQPQADLWVSLVAQTVWWGQERRGVAHAWLHYWPAGVPAMAHMSHDSDGNNDDDGQAALDAFAEADVAVTWCQVYRDNAYSPEIYAAITEAGHEHALHYNAMADAEHATWGQEQLDLQLDWVRERIGDQPIVSNKNHYTRWEGWTEFYLWLEKQGIQLDQSRGPSKIGSVGMTFGTCHLGFPMGDLEVGNRPMDVVAMPLHTQDLAWAGHISCRDVILDAAEQVHGIAHFLFHGPHLRQRPLTRAACSEVARLARDRGMVWWTAAEINTWERARRGVGVDVQPIDESRWRLTVTSDAELSGAGVVVSLPGAEGREVRADGDDGAAPVDAVVRHGHRFHEVTVDLTAGSQQWTLSVVGAG